MEVIRENFTEALRLSQPGDILIFPLDNYSSVMNAILPRLRREMWREKPDWKKISESWDDGTFQVKRIK